ncbi:MAG: chemotaxis protein CheW [Myxococcaceae bacterium]
MTPLQRALAEAPERAPAPPAVPKQEFFSFRLGELAVGVPSIDVREVVRVGWVTPLPRTPAWILGVFGLRGEVLPVLDLLRFLGKGESRLTDRTRVFVGVAGSHAAAVVTDGVLGLREVKEADIVAAPVGGDAVNEHVRGVVPARGVHQEALVLLHFSKLLQVARQRAVTR